MKLAVINKTLIPLVGKTAKMQRLFIGDRLKASRVDLTIEQWFLIARLFHEDGQNQNDLAIITDRDKASLTRLVNTLEKKNLVDRVHSVQDKRVNNIYLTKKGRVIFKKTIPVVNEAIKEMQQGIRLEERQKAMEVLRKIQNNIINLAK